ncbi:MAG TPA: 4'-phosphopantetheinyl transferase superfamily protein [Ferruginibacter sp.]|jgi:phosphopantetheinyl transferase|nr:4'-phosphopantetheinyl transferase superfamily protein [Ferruginibacter sp.]
MPLVYQQNINEDTRLGVWHIAEAEDFFLAKVPLQKTITHPHKRLQHLAGRMLLTELFSDFPLSLIEIADTRKPFLPNEAFHFSISHCGDYAAAMVSKVNRVGVDIEIISEKVGRIKDKFLSEKEQLMLTRAFEDQHEISPESALTLAWSFKEAMFKWFGDGGVDFRKHLLIESVICKGNEYLAQCVLNKKSPISLQLHGLMFNQNILTWLATR